MPRKSQKTQIVAFKVEEELAKFLDKLPNKSEFIRRAILDKFNMTCPLCNGSGVVPRGLHRHFAEVIEGNHSRECAKCSKSVSFPLNLEAVTEDDRPRLEQFYNGGPLYCEKCYESVPECDDCGWHIALESVADHHRHQHLG